MDCYLYILENRLGRHYVGITKLPPENRLARHNHGEVYSTKFGRPWQLIYAQKYDNYAKAREIEKKVKSWHGGNALRKFFRIAAGSSNGRTRAFGARYLGSNPSPAAMRKNKFGGVK